MSDSESKENVEKKDDAEKEKPVVGKLRSLSQMLTYSRLVINSILIYSFQEMFSTINAVNKAVHGRFLLSTGYKIIHIRKWLIGIDTLGSNIEWNQTLIK